MTCLIAPYTKEYCCVQYEQYLKRKYGIPEDCRSPCWGEEFIQEICYDSEHKRGDYVRMIQRIRNNGDEEKRVKND